MTIKCELHESRNLAWSVPLPQADRQAVKVTDYYYSGHWLQLFPWPCYTVYQVEITVPWLLTSSLHHKQRMNHLKNKNQRDKPYTEYGSLVKSWAGPEGSRAPVGNSRTPEHKAGAPGRRADYLYKGHCFGELPLCRKFSHRQPSDRGYVEFRGSSCNSVW